MLKEELNSLKEWIKENPLCIISYLKNFRYEERYQIEFITNDNGYYSIHDNNIHYLMFKDKDYVSLYKHIDTSFECITSGFIDEEYIELINFLEDWSKISLIDLY